MELMGRFKDEDLIARADRGGSITAHCEGVGPARGLIWGAGEGELLLFVLEFWIASMWRMCTSVSCAAHMH